MDSGPWRVDIDTDLLTLNVARSKGRWTWQAHSKSVRALAKEATEALGVPALERARFICQPWQKRKPLGDIGCHFPTIKAAVDGIVDAHVLADDKPEYLVGLIIRPPRLRPRSGLSVVIYRVDTEATASALPEGVLAATPPLPFDVWESPSHPNHRSI